MSILCNSKTLIIRKCTSFKRQSYARHRKKFKLRRLSAALKKLPVADKKLTAYRYFENRAYP